MNKFTAPHSSSAPIKADTRNEWRRGTILNFGAVAAAIVGCCALAFGNHGAKAQAEKAETKITAAPPASAKPVDFNSPVIKAKLDALKPGF